ncbi:glucose 1-dehydrogenase [Pendulispora rubella]|uniref:Glucose 1-dehydrogenase n=1 Tax=Pendulispora rubella TaxID=2741070 RepID=A0ABZ2LMS5_9BACT
MTDYTRAFRLDGKVALVTGAARGIGAEIARALAQAGARVLVTDVADDGGYGTAQAIRASGGTAEQVLHDVTSEPQWEAAIATAVRNLGGLDILVNNAGIERSAMLSQCSLEEFKQIHSVNVEGIFLGIKHATRAMSPGGVAGKGGSIINLSSVAGIIGVAGHGAYSTSKGAVRALSKSAAVECGRLGTGIRVNSIHPGLIPSTDMGTKFVDSYVELGLAPDREASIAALLALHPIGRLGEPSDIAAAALYLASDAAKWVTGSELVVDGGVAAS